MTKRVSFNDTVSVHSFVLTTEERTQKKLASRMIRILLKRRMTLARKEMTREDFIKRAKRKLDRIQKLKIINKK